MTRIYIASKTIHAERWRVLRDNGYHIISTWIDEAGVGETKGWPDLWTRCIVEASTADVLIAYRGKNEIHAGALVEVGAALAADVMVFGVGCENFSFRHHPRFFCKPTMIDALADAVQVSARHPFVNLGEIK